jgi:uncharacterized protein YxjI
MRRRRRSSPAGLTVGRRGLTSPVIAIAPDPQTVLSELEAADRLLVQQVFKPIGNEYRISVPSPGSTEEGRPLLYVKQAKLKIKEDIRFRVSPDVEEHLFMIKSKTVFEFRGRHEVLDADGAVIGLLEKDFARSLLRSHWHVKDPSGAELLEGQETSLVIALVRRVAGALPEGLSALTWLPFNFVLKRDGREVGTYRRVLGKFRDRYVLELRPEAAEVDRRLIVALAVGLDALQDR